MSAPNHQWLLQQLPKWQEEGLVTAEAAAVLRMRSENAADDQSSNTAQMVLGALGALLVGMGLIAVIGYNWDDFSRPVRLLFAFLPLLGTQLFTMWVLRERERLAAWVSETAGLLQALTAGACIALVSQIYNLGGEWEDFVLVWSLVALPLVWILGAHSVVLFYLGCITVWVIDKAGRWSDGNPWIYLALLAGLIPYVLGLGRKNPTLPNVVRWIGYWSIQCGLGAISYHAMKNGHDDYTAEFGAVVWLQMILSAMLMLIPLSGAGIGESNRRKPQVVVGFLHLLAAGMILTYAEEMERVIKGVRLALPVPWSLILLAVLVVFAVIAILRKRWALLCVAGVVLLPVIGAFAQRDTGVAAAWVMTTYLFLSGLALIVLEFTGRRGAPRLGAALLCILIIVRFSDSHFSLMHKGVVFIVVGACFLIFNIYVGRWRKARRAVLP